MVACRYHRLVVRIHVVLLKGGHAMQAGERVRWRTVNGYASGILGSEIAPDDWLVRLDNGAYVIVNINSMS